MPSMGGGGGGGGASGASGARKKRGIRDSKGPCYKAPDVCGTTAYKNKRKRNKKLKCHKASVKRKCGTGGGKISRYEEPYGEEYEEPYGEEYDEAYGEEYEEPYGEEYDEAYGEEYTMVPGTYMTDRYTELKPADVPPSAAGQSASVTKTGKPTKPPTASVSLFQNPFQGNADDAMMLSPMVEYEKSTGVPMNLAVVLLAILFISFVMMRK